MPIESLISKLWWTLLLRGIVAILFGVSTLLWPGVTLSALVLLFGFYALADGITAIVMGLREHGNQQRWWTALLGGIISVGAGIMTFMRPGITALALLSLIAAWAIIRGVFDIMAAVRLRHEIQGEWLLAFSGLLSIAFGVFLFTFPGAGALAVAAWIGIFAITMGIVFIVLGLRMRGLASAVHAHA